MVRRVLFLLILTLLTASLTPVSQYWCPDYYICDSTCEPPWFVEYYGHKWAYLRLSGDSFWLCNCWGYKKFHLMWMTWWADFDTYLLY